jgi:hypothetical protein
MPRDAQEHLSSQRTPWKAYVRTLTLGRTGRSSGRPRRCAAHGRLSRFDDWVSHGEVQSSREVAVLNVEVVNLLCWEWVGMRVGVLWRWVGG